MVWSVNKIAVPLNNKSVTVQGIPSQPMSEEFSTVKMDDNTVWIIDGFSSYIKVITRDENGFHMTNYEMTYENQY